MSRRLAVETRFGWRAVGTGAIARVGESKAARLRGLAAGERVEIGAEQAVADSRGVAKIRFAEHPSLAGHVGLVEGRVGGEVVGELEVVPDKLSDARYRTLRADLNAVWSGLIYEPDGVARAQAAAPSAAELWHRIEQTVRQIARMPAERLERGLGLVSADRARRASQLTPAVRRAALRGVCGVGPTTLRSANTVDNAMVADTLLRLQRRCHGEPEAAVIAESTARLLRRWPAAPDPRAAARVTHGMRADARYRQVLAVNQLLRRPELGVIEGPGELRLGLAGLVRLYEYWVFLQILLAARRRYGRPTSGGFSSLAVRTGPGRARATLPAGTTVTFAGPVHVAFEPHIDLSESSWQGLRLSPHPAPEHRHGLATPDVVVLAAGARPRAVVFDAKYIGRSWVERAAWDIHAKYSRLVYAGRPAVANVLAVHPHEDMAAQWPGYGHLGLIPGYSGARLDPLLPEPG